jgi:hypothetical protein
MGVKLPYSQPIKTNGKICYIFGQFCSKSKDKASFSSTNFRTPLIFVKALKSSIGIGQKRPNTNTKTHKA